ncbi:hypothetical protein MSG28_009851 [Choristoneura fumiferana]|uniref:Uncharacterized protein n=1 Tax=Choristoneura fumiferana TaxID=7141 RepID=A0ACC0JCV4_CHOFU|nr:hypothetical protein MSG28_009851 [Choristoneura fumiferana]
MNFFKKAPTVKEQQRQNDRELRKAGRELDRDKAALEREEKKLISSVQMSNKAMGANIAIAGAMGTTAKTMGNMNKVMNPHQIAKDMDAFKQANAKLDMTDEMISDTLDDIMDESGDEEETEGIVNKVLDEIGIEISGKEQEQRDMLSSQDGDTCETHDQFYRDHKLLLVLFRALAVMPITRSRPVATVVVLTVGYERILILRSTKKFDDYIYAILFVVFLVPHFWIPFVGWGVAHQTQIVVISVGCLLLAIGFLLSLCALMDGFLLRHTTAYYHIITMINMNCALWYINCKGIKIASQSLSECFRRASGMFGEVNFAIPFSVAEPVRIAAIPWQCVRSDVFYILPVHVAAGVQDTLLSIDVLAVDRPCQKEAIEMNPAVVSLKGYAHVNRELLTSAISMIAIYLVVLLQFKISLPKDIPGT